MTIFILLWDENGSVGVLGEGGGALDENSLHCYQIRLSLHAEGLQLGEIQVRVPALGEFQGGPLTGPRCGTLPGLEAVASHL